MTRYTTKEEWVPVEGPTIAVRNDTQHKLIFQPPIDTLPGPYHLILWPGATRLVPALDAAKGQLKYVIHPAAVVCADPIQSGIFSIPLAGAMSDTEPERYSAPDGTIFIVQVILEHGEAVVMITANVAGPAAALR